MWETIQRWLIGHNHVWVKFEKHNQYACRKLPQYAIYMCQCRICGKIKKFSSK